MTFWQIKKKNSRSQLKLDEETAKNSGGKFEEFEKALVYWFHEARKSNIPISGVLFKENAVFLATKFGIKNCTG